MALGTEAREGRVLGASVATALNPMTTKGDSMDALPEPETLQDYIEAARARGVPEEEIQAFLQPHRALARAMKRADDAKGTRHRLFAERDGLSIEARNREQDLELSRGRAQRHLDAARATVEPYEVALQDVARRRVELDARLEAAEQELQAAQSAEQEAFAEMRRANA